MLSERSNLSRSMAAFLWRGFAELILVNSTHGSRAALAF